MITNNITRLLQSKKIQFTTFELPPEKLGALETSQLLQVPAGQVFKTIVILRERTGKPILAIIPGDCEVDLKLVASTINEKKVRPATLKEAENLTGLETGGISPLALLQRGFQMLLDSSAENFKEIHISGGQRGLNIRLAVNDLLALTGARKAVISRPTGDDVERSNSV